MNQENINTSPAPQQKKVWQKPELYILDSNHISGGANPAHHEGNIIKTAPGSIPGNLYLYIGPNSFYSGTHTRHFYHS